MKRPVPMTVCRMGEFTIQIAEGPTKCGLRGKHTFPFEVQVTAPHTALDRRGFLIDNADLACYFEQTFGQPVHGKRYGLCERIAMRAITDHRKLCPPATRLYVKIWGIPGQSFIECEWSKQ